MAREATAPKPASRGRLTLYLGLGLGIVAAILVAIILSSQGGDNKTEKVVPATRFAVIAARDIPARTRITPDMLKVQAFKLEDVSPDAFSSVNQLTDRVTASDVKAGQEIIPSLVSNTRGEGLNFAVKPGMRAVSIGVKEVVAAGGNVVPGNSIDVIAIFGIDGGTDIDSLVAGLLDGPPPATPRIAGGKAQLTITLLQNVRVLAVAQNVQDSPAPQGKDTTVPLAAKENPNPRAATVTLEVTPRQAQILALTDEHATLRLSLRPFGEDSTAPVAPFITRVD